MTVPAKAGSERADAGQARGASEAFRGADYGARSAAISAAQGACRSLPNAQLVRGLRAWFTARQRPGLYRWPR
jgi:hypothetical protein